MVVRVSGIVSFEAANFLGSLIAEITAPVALNIVERFAKKTSFVVTSFLTGIKTTRNLFLVVP